MINPGSELGKLYLVPSPIGNLEDMTFRAKRILSEVDLILAEDTRVSSRLLQHYQIDNKLKSFHQHNEHQQLDAVIDMLKSGQQIAVLSDAGTPGISDPGFLLVRACREEAISVECLPGASALIPALIDSGLPCDRFVFEGFLPHKKGRQTRFQKLAEEDRTIVFYESPHRILKTLEQGKEYFGEDRPAAVLRELSKIHEEHILGTLSEIHTELSGRDKIRGEIVLVIAGLEKRKSTGKQDK